MKNKKKWRAILLALTVALTFTASCNSLIPSGSGSDGGTTEDSGSDSVEASDSLEDSSSSEDSGWIGGVPEETIYLRQSNATDMFRYDGGNVVLEEDIDLTEYTEELTNFTGTIDGQGHSITVYPRIKTGDAGGSSHAGLFYTFNGEIKNVAFIVNRLLYNMGGIAYIGTISLDNVFVQVKMLEMNDWNYSGGIVRQVMPLSKISLKDVVVDMPFYEGKNIGFLSGFATGTLDLADANCYFIGGNRQVIGLRDGYVTNDNVSNANYVVSKNNFASPSIMVGITEEMQTWYELYLS